MSTFFKRFVLIAVCIMSISVSAWAQINAEPVSPNSSPEAKALLEFFQDITGKYLLTGQHNYPDTKDYNTRFAYQYIGKTPVIYSQDMGFADKDSYDYYKARPAIVKEAIRQHKKGAIVTLCWHAVPPTADEPVTFKPLTGADPNKLESVQGKLTEKQYEDLLKPGTELNKRWLAQIDTVAFYLKQLQEANVPILWRPYHEMNGSWFWWGGHYKGEFKTRDLYKAMFDRYVNYHKLNNLIWVWNVDRIHNEETEHKHYFPGLEYVDILSLDVYGNDYKQKYYESIQNLAQGKPTVLGEVGNPPSLEIIEKQPNWSYWVIWAGMVRNASKTQYNEYDLNEKVLFQEDDVYVGLINSYRDKIELAPLSSSKKSFSGKWIINEEKSNSDWGLSGNAEKMEIIELGNEILREFSFVVEWGYPEIKHDVLVVGDSKTEGNSVTKGENEELIINASTTYINDDEPISLQSNEIWKVKEDGQLLIINHSSETRWGKREYQLVYDRE